MREILYYLYRMLPAALLGLLLYLISRPVRMGRLKRLGYGTSPWHEVCLVLLLVLLAGLLWLTVLPEILWENGRLILREEGFGNVNLKPFAIFWQSRILSQQGHDHYFLINFWGNIVMFMPIGLFPVLLWRRVRWWHALVSGLGLSLVIELCQIPIHRGTDIDDLWLNALGAILGWAVARLVVWLAPGLGERCKVRRPEHGV